MDNDTRPTLVYDAGCRFCRFGAASLAALDHQRRVAIVPHPPAAASALGERSGGPIGDDLVLETPGARIAVGGEAVAGVLGTLVPPLVPMLSSPLARCVFANGYRLVAANRALLSWFVPDVAPTHR